MEYSDAKTQADEQLEKELPDQTRSHASLETQDGKTTNAQGKGASDREPGMVEKVVLQPTRQTIEGISSTAHQTAETARYAKDKVAQTVRDAANYVAETTQYGAQSVGEGLANTYDTTKHKALEFGDYVDERASEATDMAREGTVAAVQASGHAVDEAGQVIIEGYEKGRERVNHGVEYIQQKADETAQAASDRFGIDCWLCARWCRLCGITFDYYTDSNRPARRRT